LGPANETHVHLRRGGISGASSKHKHLEIRFQPPDEAEQLRYFTTASLLRVDLLKAAKRIFFYSTGNVLCLKNDTGAKRVKANSHRQARHDKTVLSVSSPLLRCELDSRQLKTVADRKKI